MYIIIPCHLFKLEALCLSFGARLGIDIIQDLGWTKVSMSVIWFANDDFRQNVSFKYEILCRFGFALPDTSFKTITHTVKFNRQWHNKHK